MNLIQLYEYTERQRILVSSRNLAGKLAFCVDDNQSFRAIALDLNRIPTEQEEKSILAEEISHLEYKLTYRMNDIKNPNWYSNARQAETRAKQKAAVMLVDLSELKKAIDEKKEIWEIAEFLNVTEDEIRTAIDYYCKKNLLEVAEYGEL